ncbi:MAG: hypothetical protein AAF581_20360 [Planctomycetota bacterium]
MIRKEEAPRSWFRDNVDAQIVGLFSEEQDVVGATIQELVEGVATDEDLIDTLLETLQQSLDEQCDETQGTAWIALILGELEVLEALGPLLQATSCDDDEVLVMAAVRSLRRLGRPAFATILERLEEDDDYEAAAFAAAVQVLEGVQLHDLSDVQAEVEEALIAYLERARAEQQFAPIAKIEAVAVALAHLGVARARPVIEAINEQLLAGNAFLQEALEIMEEQPGGVPCSAAASWLEEFHWAFGEPFDAALADADEPEVTVTETDDERIVEIRAPRPDEDS